MLHETSDKCNKRDCMSVNTDHPHDVCSNSKSNKKKKNKNLKNLLLQTS